MNTSFVVALAITCLATTGCDDDMSKQQVETSTAKTPSSPDVSSAEETTSESASRTELEGTPATRESSDASTSTSESTLTQSVATNGIKADNSEESTSGGDDEETLQGEVNLNTASIDQLDMLPGVGPAIANRIADYREKRRFKKTAHLTRVKGIGEVTYSKMKAYVTVKGETTISEG